MQLGKISITGERDTAGNVGVTVSHEPSNLALSNIAVFTPAQMAERKGLVKAIEKAAADYYAFMNQDHQEVRAAANLVSDLDDDPRLKTMVPRTEAPAEPEPAAAPRRKKAS